MTCEQPADAFCNCGLAKGTLSASAASARSGGASNNEPRIPKQEPPALEQRKMKPCDHHGAAAKHKNHVVPTLYSTNNSSPYPQQLGSKRLRNLTTKESSPMSRRSAGWEGGPLITASKHVHVWAGRRERHKYCVPHVSVLVPSNSLGRPR